MEIHARRAAPREAVGAVLGTAGRAVEYSPLRNTSGEPEHAFSVDPLELVQIEGAARDRGLQLLGLFHSHPGGRPEPSEVDREQPWPGQVCWIGAVRGDGAFVLGTHELEGCRLEPRPRAEDRTLPHG
jgi:proteasome lid subunit RPN8/RPN11